MPTCQINKTHCAKIWDMRDLGVVMHGIIQDESDNRTFIVSSLCLVSLLNVRFESRSCMEEIFILTKHNFVPQNNIGNGNSNSNQNTVLRQIVKGTNRWFFSRIMRIMYSCIKKLTLYLGNGQSCAPFRYSQTYTIYCLRYALFYNPYI